MQRGVNFQHGLCVASVAERLSKCNSSGMILPPLKVKVTTSLGKQIQISMRKSNIYYPFQKVCKNGCQSVMSCSVLKLCFTAKAISGFCFLLEIVGNSSKRTIQAIINLKI